MMDLINQLVRSVGDIRCTRKADIIGVEQDFCLAPKANIALSKLLKWHPRDVLGDKDMVAEGGERY